MLLWVCDPLHRECTIHVSSLISSSVGSPYPPSPPAPILLASPLPAGSTLNRMNQALGNDKVPQLEQEILGTYWVCFTFQFQIPTPSRVSALSLRPPFILFLPTVELMSRVWILYNNPELGHQCPWVLCGTAEWTEGLWGTDIDTWIGGWEENVVVGKLLSLLQKGKSIESYNEVTTAVPAAILYQQSAKTISS